MRKHVKAAQMSVQYISSVAQSCSTLCDPMDCSLPGSSVHGILQARVLEWVAISFSRGSSQPRDQTQVSHTAGRRFKGSPKQFFFLNVCCCCMLSCSIVSDSLRPHGLQPATLLCPWDFPGKNTGVGSHFLLQGVFRLRGHTRFSCISCIGRQILYHCATWMLILLLLNVRMFQWLGQKICFLFIPQ